jgi:hypothetical protein
LISNLLCNNNNAVFSSCIFDQDFLLFVNMGFWFQSFFLWLLLLPLLLSIYLFSEVGTASTNTVSYFRRVEHWQYQVQSIRLGRPPDCQTSMEGLLCKGNVFLLIRRGSCCWTSLSILLSHELKPFVCASQSTFIRSLSSYLQIVGEIPLQFHIYVRGRKDHPELMLLCRGV